MFTKGGACLGWRCTGKRPLTQKGEFVGKASLEEALESWALTDEKEFTRQTLGGTFRELSCDSHMGLGKHLMTLKSWYKSQTAGWPRCH